MNEEKRYQDEQGRYALDFALRQQQATEQARQAEFDRHLALVKTQGELASKAGEAAPRYQNEFFNQAASTSARAATQAQLEAQRAREQDVTDARTKHYNALDLEALGQEGQLERDRQTWGRQRPGEEVDTAHTRAQTWRIYNPLEKPTNQRAQASLAKADRDNADTVGLLAEIRALAQKPNGALDFTEITGPRAAGGAWTTEKLNQVGTVIPGVKGLAPNSPDQQAKVNRGSFLINRLRNMDLSQFIGSARTKQELADARDAILSVMDSPELMAEKFTAFERLYNRQRATIERLRTGGYDPEMMTDAELRSAEAQLSSNGADADPRAKDLKQRLQLGVITQQQYKGAMRLLAEELGAQ